MRELVSQKVQEGMVTRGADYNIEFDDVSIIEMQFARDFNAAVEQKQVAQQDAERAKYLVDRAEFEKQARIIRAEGDSEVMSTCRIRHAIALGYPEPRQRSR